MCNCACLVHLLLPQIRNLKCSDLLGSGQVFGVETKTFLFLLRGECFILCSRGMLSGDLVYFTEMQKTALEQSLNSKMIQYLQEQKYCLLSSIILLYFLSTSLTFLYLRARRRYLHCWRVQTRCQRVQRSMLFWKDPHWSMSPGLTVMSCSALQCLVCACVCLYDVYCITVLLFVCLYTFWGAFSCFTLKGENLFIKPMFRH